MEKVDNKKQVFLGIFIAVLVLAIGIGITYGYFQIFMNSNGNNSDVTAESGKLDVVFETSEYISNSNARLINEEDIFTQADKTKFSVSRSEESTVENIKYNVYLDNITISNNLKNSDFKWKLFDKKNPTSADTPISSGDFSTIGNQTTIKLTTNDITLGNEVNDYTLIVWLQNDDERLQNELLLGEFQAKVSIEVTTY